MHSTFIFNGVWASAVATLVFFLEGKQARRERDEQMYEERGEKGTQSILLVELSPSQESSKEKRVFFAFYGGVFWNFAPPASSIYYFYDLSLHSFGY